MGRKKTQGRQQLQEGKLSNRAVQNGIQQSYHIQASSAAEALAADTNCDPGDGPASSHAFLSYDQLFAINPSDNVIVEVNHITDKDYRIYTTAANIEIGMSSVRFAQDMMGRTGLILADESIVNQIKQQDPGKLFHKMNSGTEEDLLRWQRFSLLSLQAVCSPYVLYGIPIRFSVDHDILPPGKHAARKRARITIPTTATMLAGLPACSMQVTFPEIAQGPATILEELKAVNDDDIIYIDMKEILGRDVVVETTRPAVQRIYNGWHIRMTDAFSCRVAERTYKQGLTKLRKHDCNDGSITSETYIQVGVLARALYSTPIRLRQLVASESPALLPEYLTKGRLLGLIIAKPTPEMLHPFDIPTSVADKGGYIVMGHFRPGFGTEAVHFKISDFKPDDDIMLHLSDRSDSHRLAARMPNKEFITTLVHVKKTIKHTNAPGQQIINSIQGPSKFPDHSSFESQIITEDP